MGALITYLDSPAGPGLSEPVEGLAVEVPEDRRGLLPLAEVDGARQLDLAPLPHVDLLRGAVDVS